MSAPPSRCCTVPCRGRSDVEGREQTGFLGVVNESFTKHIKHFDPVSSLCTLVCIDIAHPNACNTPERPKPRQGSGYIVAKHIVHDIGVGKANAVTLPYMTAASANPVRPNLTQPVLPESLTATTNARSPFRRAPIGFPPPPPPPPPGRVGANARDPPIHAGK